MEEILASIKRIIAEDGEPARAPETVVGDVDAGGASADDPEEVLELTQPLDRLPETEPPQLRPEPFERAEVQPSEPLVSRGAEDASRRSLAALAAAAIAPAPEEAAPSSDGSKTVEALVREMLRPMLREWLDENLPAIVERLVASEIERIAADRGQ